MMATRKLKSPITGKPVDATIVDIDEIKDSPTIISLSDGSVLRLRLDVIEVARFEGEWDQDGHPSYSVRSGNILAVLEAPEELMRRVQ